MLRRRKRLALVGGLLAVGFAAAGIAYAAIPDGNTINGCYGKAGGVLRVTDTAKNQKCSSQFEVPISWNQQGPKGDTGAPGEKGAQGIPGQQGPPGVSGRVVVTADYQSGGGWSRSVRKARWYSAAVTTGLKWSSAVR